MGSAIAVPPLLLGRRRLRLARPAPRVQAWGSPALRSGPRHLVEQAQGQLTMRRPPCQVLRHSEAICCSKIQTGLLVSVSQGTLATETVRLWVACRLSDCAL